MANPVQHRAVTFSAATAPTAQFSSPVTIGSRALVGVVLFPNTVTVSSVTDNGTTPNTYSNDNTNLSDGTIGDTLNTRSAQVATNPSSGNLIVTVNLSASASGVILIQEIAGSDTSGSPVDTSGTTTQTSTVTALSCTSASSAGAVGEYVFGIFGTSSNPSSWVAGAGTTLDDSDVANGAAACHRTGDSRGTGQETVNLTIGGANAYLAQVTLYKLITPGSSAPPEGHRPAALRMFRKVHRRRGNTFDLVLASATAFANAGVRYLLLANAVVNLAARYRLAVQGFKNVAARYRLMATAWRNVQARYRLQVQAWKNVAARYRLSVLSFRNVQARYRLAATAIRNVQARYRLQAIATVNVQFRYRLQLAGATTAFKNVQARYRLFVAAWRNVPARYRLSARVYINVQSRYRLFVAAWRNVKGRYRLVAVSIRNIGTRYRLRVAAFRNVAARYRVALLGIRNVAGRYRAIALGIRNVGGRYVLVGGPGPLPPPVTARLLSVGKATLGLVTGRSRAKPVEGKDRAEPQ